MIVATWNVENLFRAGTEGGPSDERAYAAKLTSLAAVIIAMAPDVLALHEIGQPEALDDLLERVGGRWETALSEFPDDRGIRVGFASRLPLDEVEQVRAFPERLQAVQVQDDGTTRARWDEGRCGSA